MNAPLHHSNCVRSCFLHKPCINGLVPGKACSTGKYNNVVQNILCSLENWSSIDFGKYDMRKHCINVHVCLHINISIWIWSSICKSTWYASKKTLFGWHKHILDIAVGIPPILYNAPPTFIDGMPQKPHPIHIKTLKPCNHGLSFSLPVRFVTFWVAIFYRNHT